MNDNKPNHCVNLHTKAHSSLRKESPAELMLLTFVWDETASGTARSKTSKKRKAKNVVEYF